MSDTDASDLEEGEIPDHVEEPPPDFDANDDELSPEERQQILGWSLLLDTLRSEGSLIDLQANLNFEAAANELESRLQKLADEGDPLMLEIRRIAGSVKEMPLAPVLVMLKFQADCLLRIRRANISTSLDGEKSTPFRGYSADVRRPSTRPSTRPSLLPQSSPGPRGAHCTDAVPGNERLLRCGECAQRTACQLGTR
jgi:hypothetical protein